MPKITLEAVRIVDAIDRRGSFAAAAKELHRVPSTVSYTVAKLEEDIGVQIFERMGPMVRLTPAGKAFLADGRALLTAAVDLEDRVRRVASGWETRLSIGMDSLFSPLALEADIRAFGALAPSTQLRITQETLSGTWESLLERRTDILIAAAGDGPSGGGYIAEPMGKLKFVFVVAPAHPLAKINRALGKDDLKPHKAIAVGDSARNIPARNVGLLFGQDAITISTMRAKLEFQIAGLGFGFLPEPCARTAIDAGLLIEKQVAEAKPAETFYLAWRTGESGAGLAWWIERMRKKAVFKRILKYAGTGALPENQRLQR